MKHVLIVGDSAVGKMTVGQELVKLTGFKLFYNHMVIEPILDIFGGFNCKAIYRMTTVVYEEFAKTENAGLVSTFMWDFDWRPDWELINHVYDVFEAAGGETFIVELTAPQAVRLERNATENRLARKPSKRNIEESNKWLKWDDENGRYTSREGEIPFKNYLRIDNTDISAARAAVMIKEHFGI